MKEGREEVNKENGENVDSDGKDVKENIIEERKSEDHKIKEMKEMKEE